MYKETNKLLNKLKKKYPEIVLKIVDKNNYSYVDFNLFDIKSEKRYGDMGTFLGFNNTRVFPSPKIHKFIDKNIERLYELDNELYKSKRNKRSYASNDRYLHARPRVWNELYTPKWEKTMFNPKNYVIFYNDSHFFDFNNNIYDQSLEIFDAVIQIEDEKYFRNLTITKLEELI